MALMPAVKDTLVVTNETKYLIVVRDFVQRMMKHSRLDAADENKIILAVDEAVTNIIEHGYPLGQEGSIEVEVESDDSRFTVRVRDEAPRFDPAGENELDIDDHVKAGRKKGLGIFLMRRIMDEVRYAFVEGRRNELTLVKYAARP